MRVVVTGATGNIGTGVVAALERDEQVDEVVGVARRAPDRDGSGASKVRWVAADVSRDDLAPAFAGADAVIHCAWVLNPSRDRRLLRAINVDGSIRTFAAARASGARVIVHASSIGAYAPGPKDRLVDESFPTTGIPGFSYSEDKVAVERHLDALEAEAPELRIVRMRPVLVLKRGAAEHLRRELFGAWVPSPLVRPGHSPVYFQHPRLRTQLTRTEDTAEAFRLALHADVRGAFNLAADPIIDGRSLAERFGGRVLPLPSVLPIRVLHELGHRLRIVPGEPGWTDELLQSPLVDAGRARRELGWTPRFDGFDAYVDVLEGMRDRAGEPTPPLDPASSGRFRSNELRGSAGARGPLSS